MELNYFTCTLGQAALLNHGRNYNTIPEFIDQQARAHPKLPAVGVYVPSQIPGEEWQHHVLTFGDVQQAVINTAIAIKRWKASHISLELAQDDTAALLCSSSWQYLFTWLALLYLGHSVLLIAPQCSPKATGRLCKVCNVRVIFHDEAYQQLAEDAASHAQDEQTKRPFTTSSVPIGKIQSVLDLLLMETSSKLTRAEISGTDTAYLHHTSGTSTGIPKPIPQTHHGAIGVLPQLDGSQHAMFTTTPMYHGGPADLFRAWTSNAMMWLFPGGQIPITATNVVKCLDVAADAASKGHVPTVRYFASVPYVLQMLAEDEKGLQHLQSMDLVGIGGAALAKALGDDLASRDINLVSRFGSAECGFLMASHCNYDENKEWQYLRVGEGVQDLSFEQREGGLFELVIGPKWPHMAKRNRDDGSFATSDLFESHPTLSKAWKYHSRADAQLTLVTGKKFDPASIESAILASSNLISDVLVFGNNEPYPGLLLFRSAEGASVSDSDLIRLIAPNVDRSNRDSPSYARIPNNMLIPMPHSEVPLEKSSKGTIVRNRAEERYSQEIQASYELGETKDDSDVPDAEITPAVLEIVSNIVKRSNPSDVQLTADTDLFSYGVDSIAAIHIRRRLNKLLKKPMPMSVIQNAATISRLATAIIDLRHGRNPSQTENQTDLTYRLAKRYSTFHDIKSQSTPETNNHRIDDATQHTQYSHPATPTSSSKGLTILLTGPTGLLASHILSHLLHLPYITQIHLLVRASTPTAAQARILKSLSSRALPPPTPSDLQNRLSIHPCTLSSPTLGLCPTTYNEISRTVDIVMHLAWSVNFTLPLSSFATTHLAGVAHLLQLCSSSPKQIAPRFVFCSSTAAVSNWSSSSTFSSGFGGLVPEAVIGDASAANETGYGRSKLCAEMICANMAREGRMRGRVKVVRVGQLSGSRETGVWNASEAYPAIMGAGALLGGGGVLPDLDAVRAVQRRGGREECSWVPVDVAARSFVEAAVGGDSLSSDGICGGGELLRGERDAETEEDGAADVEVLHLLSPPPAPSTEIPTWSTLLGHLRRHTGVSIVPMSQWLDRVEASEELRTREHAALRLVGFWREVYAVPSTESSRENCDNEDEPRKRKPNTADEREHQHGLDSSRAANVSDKGFGESGDSGKTGLKAVLVVNGADDAAGTKVGHETVPTSSGFVMTNSLKAMPSLQEAGGLDEEYLVKMWKWIQENTEAVRGEEAGVVAAER